LQANCYILFDHTTHQALVVDPGDAPEYISDVLSRESFIPIGIVATHGHFDHLLGAFGLQETYGVPFYIHPEDAFLVSRMQSSARYFLKRTSIDPGPRVLTPVNEGALLKIGNGSIRILHVPGHTPGSIALCVPSARAILVGDTLFADGSVGRTDTQYGNQSQLQRSIERIVKEKNMKILYPGHGEPLSMDRAKVMFGV